MQISVTTPMCTLKESRRWASSPAKWH